MDASTSRRSRGRPRVPDKARKKNNVTIRMRDELKLKVEQNAAAHQRSISEEIAWRLERSFTEQAALGGPEVSQDGVPHGLGVRHRRPAQCGR